MVLFLVLTHNNKHAIIPSTTNPDTTNDQMEFHGFVAFTGALPVLTTGAGLGRKLGMELGSPLGDTLGLWLGIELGDPLGMELGVRLGFRLGLVLGV
jgi:hypothetical protein